MITYALSTAPTSEPVTVDEVKDDRRITTTDDDDYIDSLITAARLHIEHYTRKTLVTQTWLAYLDGFPSLGYIELDKPPLASVSSVQYVDENGSTQTFSSSNYVVDTTGAKGRIRLAYSQSWPTTRAQPQAVTITFVSGYGEPLEVPEDIKRAIKLLVGHWYENREATTGFSISELPFGLNAILSQLKVWEIY